MPALSSELRNRLERVVIDAQLLPRIDDILTTNIHIATDVTSASTEAQSPDYPIGGLQQLVRNAIMHRDYSASNAPTRITWFNDRIEIQNPGRFYGQVNEGLAGRRGRTCWRRSTKAPVVIS